MDVIFSIGDYDFIRMIGRGGQAFVWEGRKKDFHDFGRLAIKFLLEEFSQNEEMQNRFYNEALIQSRLRHDNIIRVTGFTKIDGKTYMVMDYIEPPVEPGKQYDEWAHPLSLNDRLKNWKNGLTLSEIKSISVDVLGALQYAHNKPVRVGDIELKGIVHRDIKPQNIILSIDGKALLTDFGIAKLLTDDASRSLTGSKNIGTRDYMSPEQVLGSREIDGRADIYSFGCVLYAMLSGKPPFAGVSGTGSAIEVAQCTQEPPPLTSSHLWISPEINKLVFRCLEKKPENRFQTCAQVIEAINAAFSPGAIAEAQARGKAEAAALARHQAEIQARAEAEAKAKAKAEADAKAKAEAKARADAEVEARAKARARIEAEARLKSNQTSDPTSSNGMAKRSAIAAIVLALVGGGWYFRMHKQVPIENPVPEVTVPTPTISPNGGDGTHSISLADSDSASTIYYTTDGSTPTQYSSVYTKPFTLPKGGKVQAIAMENGHPSSRISVASFADQTAPLQSHPDNGHTGTHHHVPSPPSEGPDQSDGTTNSPYGSAPWNPRN